MNPTRLRPRLPAPLARPFALVPERLQSLAAAQLINRVFARQRLDGELDFLKGRRVRIRVDDVGSGFSVQWGAQGFEAAAATAAADLTISGSLYDYMLLITAREDPDTLFFQRRLRMEGDTALGVYLKNFLAGLDPEELPLSHLVQPALQRGLDLYQRLV